MWFKCDLSVQVWLECSNVTQVFKCDLRLSAVTGHLIPRQTLVTTHVSSFSTKIFSLRSLWPHTPLRIMHILNIMGPWLRDILFGFCCNLGTASVLALAPTKTGGLHSLVGSGWMSLLQMGTSASEREAWSTCALHKDHNTPYTQSFLLPLSGATVCFSFRNV